MPRALETNAGIAIFLQTAEFFGLGLDYDVRLPDHLRAVTLDEVNAAARRVLDPDRATVVIAGPYEDPMTRHGVTLTPTPIFFDVDFTLIYPGPTFRSEGYRAFCERHGMEVDESRVRRGGRERRVAARRSGRCRRRAYDAEIFVAYTRHIIEQMGGRGPSLDACAREIYAEWAACQHFELYDDVPAVLRRPGGRAASASG